MLVKIPSAPDDLVERLKRVTGTATASKAFMACALSHEKLRAQVDDQQAQIDALKTRLGEAQQIISSAKSAAAGLLGRIDPAKKSPASLKDLGDWFETQAALDLDGDDELKKRFAAGDLPGMPYV